MTEEKDDQQIDLGIPKDAVGKAADQIRVRTERFRQLYSNNMQIGFSSWDMAITFGEIIGDKDGKVVVEETVRIVMPREIGKVLARLLSGNIAAYEQQFGEIKIPTLAHGDEEVGDEETDTAPETAMVRATKKARPSSK